jgi:hypothetical protein
MMVFAIGIEHALDVAIDRPHDANAREQRFRKPCSGSAR